MKRIVAVFVIALLFAVPAAEAAEKIGENVAGSRKTPPKKKHGKKQFTKKQADLLRKQSEQQGRQHELERRKQEYQQSLDAQRRGMIEMNRMQQQRDK